MSRLARSKDTSCAKDLRTRDQALKNARRDSELTAHLRKCTALLSPSLRRTFQLRVVDGLSIFKTYKIGRCARSGFAIGYTTSFCSLFSN
jgi:hypothetical protein